jgi:outer membrane cobalamin receptor
MIHLGKGEVGTDLKSIPSAALQNVEVLRDGASAQYGSDAIAGVINIILKNSVGKSTVNLFQGLLQKETALISVQILIQESELQKWKFESYIGIFFAK